MKNVKFVAIVPLLLGLLTACPPPPAPVVSVVTIAGAPADNAIKINSPINLTATAADVNGTAIGGLTFNWVSSNPDAVSVDANGVVTAKKFGTAVISATASGVTGSTAAQNTYGLEAVFGTRYYKTNASTLRFYRFRLKPSETIAANSNLIFSTTGPSSWNNNQVATNNATSGSTASSFFGNRYGAFLNAAPVSGQYSMSVTYNNETYTSFPTTFDITSRLDAPTITITSATTTSVSATWTAVTNAVEYAASARNTSDNSSIRAKVVGAATQATIDTLSLDATKVPKFSVFVVNFDPDMPAGSLFPAQANQVVEDIAITLP